MNTYLSNLGWPAMIGLLLLCVRIALYRIDRSCIRGAVRSAGVTLLKISWSPFGYGSGGSQGRLYEVWYRASDGVVASSTCQTSLFGGIFWGGGTSPSMLARIARSKNAKPRAGADC